MGGFFVYTINYICSMAEDLISSIVDPKAYKQLDDLTGKLKTSQQVLTDNITAAIKLNAVLGNSKSLKDLEKNYANAIKVIAEMQRQQAKVIVTEQQLETKRAAQAAKSSKQITEQSRLYTQLSNTLEKLRKDAQDVGARFGENSVQFQKAAVQVQNLDAKLKAIDNTLGKNQRSVGNYAGALRGGFNGLGNSINQISRELPNFAISAQIGILALSNNLPILMDNLKSTQAEIAAMRAEGQKVPGLFKQIASSIFSWGTALTLGITLAIVFSKQIGEFVSALFKGKDALNQFTENQKALGEALKESNVDAGKQIAVLKTLYTTAIDVNETDAVRLKAVKQLQELFPKTFANATAEQIKNGELSESYKILTKDIIENARARAINQKLGEIVGKQLDSEIQKRKEQNAFINETIDNKQLSKEDANNKRAIAMNKNFVAQREEIRQLEITGRAKEAADARKAYDDNLQAQFDFLRKFAGNEELIDDIAGKQGLVKALKESADKSKEIYNSIFEDAAESSKKIFEVQQLYIEAYSTIEDRNRKKQADNFALFLKNVEETEAKKKAILEQADKDAEQMAQSDEDRRTKRFEDILKYEQMAYDVATAFLSAKFVNEKNALADIERAQQETFEKEAEQIRNSLLSSQEKANQLQVLESKRASQKALNERKEQDIELRRAKFDRAAALFQIAITTAVNIIKSLLIPGGAIAAAAAGAAEAAIVLAAPLPKFKEGGKMKETGLAEYGHGTELRIDPEGKISLTGSTPEIGLVKKGTEFISNKELVRMMAKPDQISYVGGQAIDMKDVIASQEKSRKDIVGAINNQQIGGSGIKYYSTSKGRSYLKRNLN